jgi:epoxyqueuosine reductase
MTEVRETLRQAGYDVGFDLVGFCSADRAASAEFFADWLQAQYHGTMDFLARSETLRADPESVLPGARSAIVVGLNYLQPRPVQPKIARYALGRDYHKVLRGKLRRLGEAVRRLDPDATTRSCVDTAPIFEREMAVRAGIGWLGKNSCVINSHRGSWFFLGVLLTTLEIEPDKESTGGCGSCHRCVEACPTGAIVQLNGRWTVDSRRCISYLTIEHRGESLEHDTDGWVYGCDVCQEVCPFNEPRDHQPLRARLTTEPDFQNVRSFPDLQRLRVLTDEEWDTMTRGAATRRASAAMWRRNARHVR